MTNKYFNKKAHDLAFNYINNNVIISELEANSIVSKIGFNISKMDLDHLINLPRLHFKDINSETGNSCIFKNNLGTIRSKLQASGVYIFTHKATGSSYVGSSSQLSRRLVGYFRKTHRSTGKFLPLLYNTGIDNFSLDVIVVENGMHIVLEQYFLLHKKYNLNTLKIANSIYSTKNKPLYLYTKNPTKLTYYS